MNRFPALGQIYLQTPSSLDSYLPEFVLQSQVFNKQVKNVLLKISDIQASTTNTLPIQYHHQQLPSFSSIHQQIHFLRSRLNQKNKELENYRKQIEDVKQMRMSDCGLIQQLENRNRVLQEQRQQEYQTYKVQKQHLMERMIRIEQQIDIIGPRDEGYSRGIDELQTENEILKQKLKQHQRVVSSESINIVDSYRIQQMTRQIEDLKNLNNNLVMQNSQYKFQLQISTQSSNQLQDMRHKILQQQKLINDFKYSSTDNHQLIQKLQHKQNQLSYQSNTIQSLNKQIKNLRLNIDQINNQNSNYQSQSLMTIKSHAERQAEYLNRQIQQLKRQVQEITKRQAESYDEKVKYQRECYKLTNDLHELTLVKGDLQSKRFQIEMNRNQLIRVQGQLDVQIVNNKQLTNTKRHFQQLFNKGQLQKHQLSLKLQSLQRQEGRNTILENQINQMSQQLSQIHQKYLETNTKSSQIVLKYQMTLKQTENVKGLLNTVKFDSQNYRHNVQNILASKQLQLNRLKQQNRQIINSNQRLQSHCNSLQKQLNYNDSKFITFQQNLLEFQKSYKQLQLQLQQIKSSITQLQKLQNIFLNKQNQLMDMVSINVNRLIKYRESIRIQQNYKLQKRNTLLNQIIQIIQSQNSQIIQTKQFIKTLEDNLNKQSAQVDKNRLIINTLTFQKQHLFNQLDSVLDKLKYVESHLDRQTKICQMQQQEIEHLKKINRNSVDRLGEEMQKKLWLENRLSGVDDRGIDIQGMKIQRNETIKRMRGILGEE